MAGLQRLYTVTCMLHAYYWQLPRMATPAARLAACVHCLTAAGELHFVGMLLNHTSDAHATSAQLPQTAAVGCRSVCAGNVSSGWKTETETFSSETD